MPILPLSINLALLGVGLPPGVSPGKRVGGDVLDTYRTVLKGDGRPAEGGIVGAGQSGSSGSQGPQQRNHWPHTKETEIQMSKF